MVRTLTSTLTTAVGAKTRIPAVTLTAQDDIKHLQNSISTSNTDVLTSSCVANDGSIIRVQLTRGASNFAQNFQWQRITDVTSATQWQTWTTFTGGSGNMFQDGGCAVSNNSGTIRAFAQQGTGGNAIFTWSSSNNGVSWSGSATTVLSPPISALINGISSAGNNDVFFLYGVSGGAAIGSSVFSGSWSSLQVWSLPNIPFLSGASGLAVVWHSADSLYYIVYSDFQSLHLATATSNRVTWTALQDIIPAGNLSIQRVGPQITLNDGVYYLASNDVDNGTYTGTTYQYPRVRASIDLIHWSNGFIVEDMTGYYSAPPLIKTQAPSNTRQIYVMANMTKVFYSNAYLQSDATQYADVSAKILEYKRTDLIGKPSTIAVALDNTNSAITSLVSTYGSTYEPFGLNNKFVLSEGYKTGTPPSTVEVVNTGTYRIKSIIFERAPGVNHIVLDAHDLSYLLDYKNRFQTTYINQNVTYMIKEICARAGLLNLSLPSTSQMSTNIVAFILHAGQTYRSALDEVCRVGWLEYFMDQTETLVFRELSAGDSSVWSYTPEIETLALGSDDIRSNHVIVTGLPPNSIYAYAITNGEAYDTTHAHVTGQERAEVDSDTKLVSATLCASKASFIMQQEQRDQVAHRVTVPLNPALQLLDVVTLNDQAPLIGTSQSAVARIVKDSVHYLPEHAIYEMTLDLEGV